MTVFLKKSGTVLASLAFMVGIAIAVGTHDFRPNEIRAEGPSSLHQTFNFNDGGSSSNSPYAGVNLATNVSYGTDNPGGAGTTAWEADYANLSLAYGTRLGGKLASAEQTDNSTAWCNIKTTFVSTLPIDVVTLRDTQYFGTGGNALITGLYLQSSPDLTTWTTVKTLALPGTITISTTATGDGIDIVFDGFTIATGSYIRFGIGLTASAVNSGIQFGGMAFNSYTLCV